MRAVFFCMHALALSALIAAEQTDCPVLDQASCGPPDCRWDGRDCQAICMQYRRRWKQDDGSADMPGAGSVNTETALECQQRCNTTDGCQHFSYWPQQGNCHLQDAGSQLEADNGAISAVPDCEEVCFTVSHKYEPEDMAGQSRSETDSPLECQQRCATVTGCVHFSWWFHDGGCHLQDTSANQVDAHDTISGPRVCTPPPTPSPTPLPTPVPSPGPMDGGVESSPPSLGEASVIGNASAISSLKGFASLDDVGPAAHKADHVQLSGVWVVAATCIVLGVVFGAPCVRDRMHVAAQDRAPAE